MTYITSSVFSQQIMAVEYMPKFLRKANEKKGCVPKNVERLLNGRTLGTHDIFV